MRATEFIVETAMMDLSPQTIHKLADRKGVKWDNEPSFLKLTKQLTGKEHLDDLDQAGLNKVKRHLDGLQGVVDDYSNTTFNVDRRKLNVPALIQKGAILVTHPHGEQGWETDNKEDWAFSLISLYNVLYGGWPSEAKKYLKPQSYIRAEQQINSSAPNLGSDKLVYDGKYNQILWSIKQLGIPDNVAFLDKDKQGVAEGSLNEYRDQLWSWVQSKFPRTHWPEYVQRDFLYAKAKGMKNQKDLEDFLDEIQQDYGNCKWTLTKIPITLDIFTPKTQRMIQSREGGSSNPFQVPRDAERHAQQSQMIQQKGVSAEPIIVAKLANGYDLIEGWHRTIQHLKAFPQGYTGPAWVCTGATYKSESVEQGVAEGLDQDLTIQQLATISDAALDKAYGYGRSTPGNTFGWQANLMSAAYAKKMIDAGVTDIEKISDAIHKGWNVTAQKFVQNSDQFDDTEKLRQAGKLEAKLQQRAKLMKINYAQLDNEEQEKDRVVARALLQAIKGQQGVAEGYSNAVTFFRGEPILSQERLNQLKSSIGKPYPILRKEGSAANIGTYMSPDGDKATSFVKQALAGQGKSGVVTQIQVNPNSFSKGDGGIDEAVIITNIAGLVSNQTPNKNDPLRIQDRKQAMLKYLGPGVKKYLNDPLLSDPKIVQSWYNPEFAQKNWNTINSGKQAVTKPGESNIQERMIRILGPLAENIRRDPEVINYFISHNPGDWVEYNFRMNSDGSGTKVVDVKYYPPAKQGVAEGMK